MLVAGALMLAVWVPYQRWTDGQARIAALKAEEAQLGHELVALQQEYLDALGPAETERLARQRLGMVRGGERAYVVPSPEASVELPEVEEPAAAETGGWLSGSGSALMRVLRSLI